MRAPVVPKHYVTDRVIYPERTAPIAAPVENENVPPRIIGALEDAIPRREAPFESRPPLPRKAAQPISLDSGDAESGGRRREMEVHVLQPKPKKQKLQHGARVQRSTTTEVTAKPAPSEMESQEDFGFEDLDRRSLASSVVEVPHDEADPPSPVFMGSDDNGPVKPLSRLSPVKPSMKAARKSPPRCSPEKSVVPVQPHIEPAFRSPCRSAESDSDDSFKTPRIAEREDETVSDPLKLKVNFEKMSESSRLESNSADIISGSQSIMPYVPEIPSDPGVADLAIPAAKPRKAACKKAKKAARSSVTRSDTSSMSKPRAKRRARRPKASVKGGRRKGKGRDILLKHFDPEQVDSSPPLALEDGTSRKRSRRVRVPPLKWWLGEHCEYERGDADGPCLKAIVLVDKTTDVELAEAENIRLVNRVSEATMAAGRLSQLGMEGLSEAEEVLALPAPKKRPKSKAKKLPKKPLKKTAKEPTVALPASLRNSPISHITTSEGVLGCRTVVNAADLVFLNGDEYRAALLFENDVFTSVVLHLNPGEVRKPDIGGGRVFQFTVLRCEAKMVSIRQNVDEKLVLCAPATKLQQGDCLYTRPDVFYQLLNKSSTVTAEIMVLMTT
ncbi:MAG: hypothetical protein KVP17_003284 [Porospora cf. gigantea B]|uniref:uncharacterized protein n=1 Tax=Porospora cf. gigantea B TaxID=2853592 RepID=UPI003571FA1C|nr:MAG: hypothetical protein KVP17_003284 [Porospora cf. gigantea B]